MDQVSKLYKKNFSDAIISPVCPSLIEYKHSPIPLRQGKFYTASVMFFRKVEAKKKGMKLWILDDKHFPTGYANGLIEKK